MIDESDDDHDGKLRLIDMSPNFVDVMGFVFFVCLIVCLGVYTYWLIGGP